MSRIFCIGRNYLEHIEELSNQRPAEPVIFMKPGSCLTTVGSPIAYPVNGNDLQHEVEIVYRVGKAGQFDSSRELTEHLDGVTIGLDLTLRDVQSELKKKGLPWEKAKAFDGSAPIGKFVPVDKATRFDNLSFGCRVNGIERQSGNSGLMIFNIAKLLAAISRIWDLVPGDLIFTGTPAGVGSLEIGDEIEIFSDFTNPFQWTIVE